VKIVAIVALTLVGLIFVAGVVGAFLSIPAAHQYDYMREPEPLGRRILDFVWWSLIVPVLTLALFLLACGFVGRYIIGPHLH
jgi:hypothetical protein